MVLKKLTIFGVLCTAFAGELSPAKTLGGPGRQAHVKLLSHAVVQGSIVRLADLLPSTAPVKLRAGCLQLALGTAPQRGAARSFTRSQVKAALLNTPDLLDVLEIPALMQVERYRRPLTSHEISKTIDLEAGRRGLGEADRFRIRNYELTAPVMVSTTEPGLKVTRIDSDNRCQCTRFRLVATNEPDLLPFTVTVPLLVSLPPSSAAIAGAALHQKSESVRPGAATAGHAAKNDLAASASAVSGPSSASATTERLPQTQAPHPFHPPAPPLVLVQPGALATLLVMGKGFQIKTVVIPLQEGSLGQQIRVRSLESHQVLSAQVVGRNRLRSDF